MGKYRLSTLLFAGLLMAGCQKDPTQTFDVPTAGSIKASATFESLEASEEAFDIVWEPDVDRIGLFTVVDGAVDESNVYYAAYSGGEGTVSFVSPDPEKSLEWNQSVGSCDLYSYYPYRFSHDDLHAIPVSVPSLQSGGVDNVSVLKKQLCLYAAANGVSTSSTGAELEFTSPAAIIKLKLSSTMPVSTLNGLHLTADAGVVMAYDAATLDITDGTVSISPDAKQSNSIEYKFSKSVTLTANPVNVYILVNPLSKGLSLDLEFEYSGGQKENMGRLEIPGEGLVAGSMAVYSVEVENDAVNLNVAGTANTYLVTKAGTTYYFDASVKGNGVARSFTWEEADGTQVTRAYTEADLALSAEKAMLLWYNTPETADGWSGKSPVVTNSVSLSGGMIFFSTPDPFVPGNAVIAAFDSSGNIIWSWNIWAVEGYDPDASVCNVGGYMMMDRNLGAMAGPEVMNNPDKREAAWAIGNYYQWGRKDPFPAAAEYDDGGLENDMYWGIPTYTPITDLAQDFSGSSWGASNMMFGNDPVSNSRALGSILGSGFTTEQGVAESIAYPHKWISYTGSDCRPNDYLWMLDYNSASSSEAKGSWRYLWGAPEIDKIAGNDNLKTIYDPCPVGWKVAPAEAYAFAIGNIVKKTWGYYNERYDIYLPFTGQRQAGFGGSQIRALTNGTMFLSSACVGEKTLQKASETGIATFNTYIGAGYNLRCVKENVGSQTLPHSGPRCLLIGNSITRTWNTYHPEFFTDNDFLGKGIDGQTSEQIKNRFFSDAIANDPQCVHIACGINDMANNDGAERTNEGIFENIKEMAEMAASKGIKVIIGSTPPANNIWWQDEAWNAANDVAQRVIDLNAMLKAYAEERGFIYVDYHSVLKDENNGLKKEYQVDAVHPNLEGFKVMEELLLQAVDQAFYNPDAVTPGSDGPIDDFEKEEWN